MKSLVNSAAIIAAMILEVLNDVTHEPSFLSSKRSRRDRWPNSKAIG